MYVCVLHRDSPRSKEGQGRGCRYTDRLRGSEQPLHHSIIGLQAEEWLTYLDLHQINLITLN